MSGLHRRGLWHYEFISERGEGHQWRVADLDDDVVTDFATEAEALEHVVEHNATIPKHSDKWVNGQPIDYAAEAGETEFTEQKRFLLSCLEENAGIQAPINSPMDKKFQALVKLGILNMYDTMFHCHYYELTVKGRELFRG